MRHKRLWGKPSKRIAKVLALLRVDALSREVDWRRNLVHRRISVDDTAVALGLARETLGKWLDGSIELGEDKLARVKLLLRTWRKEDAAAGIGASDTPSWVVTLDQARASLDWVDATSPEALLLDAQDCPQGDD